MLLNALALLQCSPSLTSDTVDHCILRNTSVFLVFQGTILSWFCPTLLTTSLLSPLLILIFPCRPLYVGSPDQALDSTYSFACLSSHGFKHHHKLMVPTITSPFQTSFLNPRIKYSTILWNLHLAIQSCLTFNISQTDHSHPCPLNAYSILRLLLSQWLTTISLQLVRPTLRFLLGFRPMSHAFKISLEFAHLLAFFLLFPWSKILLPFIWILATASYLVSTFAFAVSSIFSTKQPKISSKNVN